MNGQPLLDWHPLISGTQQSVVDADVSIADKTLSEDNVHDDDRLIFWSIGIRTMAPDSVPETFPRFR